MDKRQIVIIGGGPAGMAAAVSAKREGIQEILIIERDKYVGGILNQCIHSGFGLHTFHEELTGPEYAKRYREQVEEQDIDIFLNTMVVDINQDKVITCINQKMGIFQIKAEGIILAMGCRERPRGALNIPGYRPAGIFTAGTAQRLVNIEGYMPGRKVVILGSGDIGLIMARRMTLEGAKVEVVAEIMPYSSGLKRNIVQCLEDYNIPLKLNHTVVNIEGRERVESVTIAEVDKNRRPILGTEIEYDCDTLLLSVGLIPENELSNKIGIILDNKTNGPIVNESFETEIPGIFACGNVLHVHDLVDYVSEEAEIAGKKTAEFVKNRLKKKENCHMIQIKTGEGVTYTVPKKIYVERMSDDLKIRFRVNNIYKNYCIVMSAQNEHIKEKKRMIMAPGEMEEIILKKDDIENLYNISEITIALKNGENKK